MRMHRWISALSLAAALSVAACGGGEEGQSETGNNADAAIGSSDGVSPTGDKGSPGAGEGGTSLGSPSAQEQTTTVDDTTPHRPGTPATP
jgi:hypothetical protein